VLLDRAGGASERGGDVGFGLVGEVAERDHLALARGQPAEGVDERGALHDERVELIGPVRLEAHLGALATALAGHAQGEVGGDSGDPRLVVGGDALPAGVRPRQRLLSQVLRLLAVAEHAERNPVGERGEGGGPLVEPRPQLAHHPISTRRLARRLTRGRSSCPLVPVEIIENTEI
jgi:hypothetical protein